MFRKCNNQPKNCPHPEKIFSYSKSISFILFCQRFSFSSLWNISIDKNIYAYFIYIFYFQTYQKQTANGPVGLNVQNHVEQANNLEVLKSKHNMGAKYALDYHRGTVTPTPVQVSTIRILYLVLNIKITSNSPIANP